MSKKEFKKDIIIKDEDFDNLVGFFKLLLKVDMRNNSELYKTNNKEKND